MTKHMDLNEFSTPGVTDIPPDRAKIGQAVETANSEGTTATLALQRFDAANPTAHLQAELTARKAELARRQAERASAQRARDEFGLFWVRMVAPFAGNTGWAWLLTVIAALCIYAIETGALWYAQTVYVAQAAFFDKIADDLLLSLPYTAVVLFAAPVLFGIGLRQRNNIRQSRFAVWMGVLGLICLFGFLTMLAVMASGLLPVRSPYAGWFAFALIAMHGPASVLMGAALGLFIHLNRQDSGTQQVETGKGYDHGHSLLLDREAEEFKVVARIGELEKTLAVIAAGRVACETAWLAELADIQADLAFAAARGRAECRREIIADARSATFAPIVPTIDATNPTLALN